MNEISETITSLSGESYYVHDEAVSVQSDSQAIEGEPAGLASTSGTLVEADSAGDTLVTIANDVHLILVFTILSFAMSCMRGWRNHVLKGV